MSVGDSISELWGSRCGAEAHPFVEQTNLVLIEGMVREVNDEGTRVPVDVGIAQRGRTRYGGRVAGGGNGQSSIRSA